MLFPTWTVPGVLVEARELKTKEGKTWAHSLKIVAMGGTYEVTTKDESLIKHVAGGMQVFAEGTFESFNGSLKLVLSKVSEMKPEAPARPNGSVAAAK